MNKILILFLLIGCILPQNHILSNALIENDVIISNALPDWGTVCIASEVRGGPDEIYAVRYTIDAGVKVRIHDQSRPDGTWVAIGSAQWLPLKNLC